MKRESIHRLWLLLIQRRNLKHEFPDLENSRRHSLKVFGLRFDRGRAGRL
jgi:transposase